MIQETPHPSGLLQSLNSRRASNGRRIVIVISEHSHLSEFTKKLVACRSVSVTTHIQSVGEDTLCDCNDTLGCGWQAKPRGWLSVWQALHPKQEMLHLCAIWGIQKL